MKTCFKCGASKPLADFYRHSAMADGCLNKCKECTKSDNWNHRRVNLEKIRAYDRERGALPHRIKGSAENTKMARRLFSSTVCQPCIARESAVWRGEFSHGVHVSRQKHHFGQ